MVKENTSTNTKIAAYDCICADQSDFFPSLPFFVCCVCATSNSLLNTNFFFESIIQSAAYTQFNNLCGGGGAGYCADVASSPSSIVYCC